MGDGEVGAAVEEWGGAPASDDCSDATTESVSGVEAAHPAKDRDAITTDAVRRWRRDKGLTNPSGCNGLCAREGDHPVRLDDLITPHRMDTVSNHQNVEVSTGTSVTLRTSGASIPP